MKSKSEKAKSRCKQCGKRVSGEFRKAHALYHVRGGKVRRVKKRSPVAAENLRLSRVRRDQMRPADRLLQQAPVTV